MSQLGNNNVLSSRRSLNKSKTCLRDVKMRMRQDLMPFLLKMDLLFRTSYTKEFQNFSKQESFQDISIESSPLECHLHSALWKFDTFPDLMYPTIFEKSERRGEACVRVSRHLLQFNRRYD